MINFTSVKGSRYDHKPLSENLSISIAVKIAENRITVKEHRDKMFSIANPGYIPKDIEITEYNLIAKQISGDNLFEHHQEHASVGFTASRPIRD